VYADPYISDARGIDTDVPVVNADAFIGRALYEEEPRSQLQNLATVVGRIV
jgi:hypothetical protein